MWIGITKTENKGIGISLGIKKKELDQDLEFKKWNWTQVCCQDLFERQKDEETSRQTN